MTAWRALWRLLELQSVMVVFFRGGFVGVKALLGGSSPSFTARSPVSNDSRRNIQRSLQLGMSTDATTTTRTLAPGSHVSEMEVKKSRFLGYATHAETWQEAASYIESIKVEHPKARHWCYGFQCGVNPVSERCSDDGEPTGTAGLPILGTKAT